MVSDYDPPVMLLGAVCRPIARCLATGRHADGYGAAGGYRRCAGCLPLLAIQKKALTLCKRHLRVPLIEWHLLTM